MRNNAPIISRDEPLPAEWSVEQGLQAYLDENGFKASAYNAPWTPASFMGIAFSVPNPPRHRRAIMLHDLHHVATGFGTDPAGEGQISAWECRRGLRGLGLYVQAIIILGALSGLVVAPRKTLRSWSVSAGGKSLFSLDARSYEELIDLSIGKLRELLGIDEQGVYRGRRGLHSLAPKKAG